jgi:hypothetical protein
MSNEALGTTSFVRRAVFGYGEFLEPRISVQFCGPNIGAKHRTTDFARISLSAKSASPRSVKLGAFMGEIRILPRWVITPECVYILPYIYVAHSF